MTNGDGLFLKIVKYLIFLKFFAQIAEIYTSIVWKRFKNILSLQHQ